MKEKPDSSRQRAAGGRLTPSRLAPLTRAPQAQHEEARPPKGQQEPALPTRRRTPFRLPEMRKHPTHALLRQPAGGCP